MNYFIYIISKENMARQRKKFLVKTNIYGKGLKKVFHILVSELFFFFFHYYFIIVNLHYIEDMCKVVNLSFT